MSEPAPSPQRWLDFCAIHDEASLLAFYERYKPITVSEYRTLPLVVGLKLDQLEAVTKGWRIVDETAPPRPPR